MTVLNMRILSRPGALTYASGGLGDASPVPHHPPGSALPPFCWWLWVGVKVWKIQIWKKNWGSVHSCVCGAFSVAYPTVWMEFTTWSPVGSSCCLRMISAGLEDIICSPDIRSVSALEVFTWPRSTNRHTTNYTWWSSISSGRCTGLECSAGVWQICWIVRCVQATDKNSAVSGIFQQWLNMIVPVVTVAVTADMWHVTLLFVQCPCSIIVSVSL